jgi:CRP/FNR family cyclic AMP-dependent transcriptional regulator
LHGYRIPGFILSVSSSFSHDYLSRLKRGKWFSSIGPALQKQLLDGALIRTLREGERLFSRGAPPCGLYAVLEGVLQVSAVGGQPDNTREAILAWISQAHWFGELSLLDGGPRSHDVAAVSAAVLLHVPQHTMARMLMQTPEYWRELGRLQSYHLRLLAGMWEDVGLLSAPEQLVRRLLLIAERYRGWHDAIPPQLVLNLSQHQLSLMLAISRQTVNLLLKELERQGLIALRRNEIEILNYPGLRAASVPCFRPGAQ